MIKRYLVLLISILLLYSEQSHAQYRAQSSTKPLPFFSQRVYVVIPSTGFAATHIKTKRVGRHGDEYIDLINILIPESAVLKRLNTSHDMGSTGLYIHDQLLVTMAVLPDLKSGQVTWVPIQLDTVAPVKRVAWEVVADDCYTRLFNYEALGGPEIDWSRRRLDFHPVIKQGTQYVTTNQSVLTEYFVIRDRPTWYPTTSDNATINCLARLFTPLDYAKEYALATAASSGITPRLEGELGTKLMLQKSEGTTFTFWSLKPLIADGGVAQFGVGDLRYRTGVGLISGKYASYFGLADESKYNTFFDLMAIQILSNKN